jgi:pyruvate/2-oxoglutarate/acetoin dehydrogenase E1 component
MSFIESINKSLEYFLAKDKNNYLIGEDLLDPYGGAFKATKNLSNKFKNQVISMPISESGFVGMATGMTFSKINVVVEIMFSDFLPIISDTLINTASKINLISKDLIQGKLFIRTPNGGRRGYGPIHSQSLEKIFFGFSEINLISLNIAIDPIEIYKKLFSQNYSNKINLILETKTDYPKKILSESNLKEIGFSRKLINTKLGIVELYNSSSQDSDVDFLFLCYGGMLDETIKAATKLFIEEEMTSKILIPHQINPIENELVDEIYSNNFKKMVVVEENTVDNSWGSLILSKLISFKKNKNFFNDIILLGSVSELISANVKKEKDNLLDSEKIFNKLLKSL